MTALDSAPGTGGRPAGAEAAGAAADDVPQRTGARSPPQRRPLTLLRLADVVSIVGALFAAVATTGLLWIEVSPFSGIIGAVVVCLDPVRALLRGPRLLRREPDDGARPPVVGHGAVARDRWSSARWCFVIIYTFFRGGPALVHLNFYTQDGRHGGPLSPLTQSGALHAVVGTLIELGIAMGIALPARPAHRGLHERGAGPRTRGSSAPWSTR